MIYFLQDAMKLVLRKNAKPMAPKDIAELINKTKLYQKADNTEVSENDVYMRAFIHGEMFRIDEEKNLISFNPFFKEARSESSSDNKFII